MPFLSRSLPFPTCQRLRGELLLLSMVLYSTLASLGCSDHPRAYPAAGTVKYSDGAPLADARIELRSVEQPYTARGKVDLDGKFVLTTFENGDGAIAGKHQVLLIQRFSANIDDMATHADHISSIRSLDRKYSKYGESGLEITIDPRADNTNIELVVE